MRCSDKAIGRCPLVWLFWETPSQLTHAWSSQRPNLWLLNHCWNLDTLSPLSDAEISQPYSSTSATVGFEVFWGFRTEAFAQMSWAQRQRFFLLHCIIGSSRLSKPPGASFSSLESSHQTCRISYPVTYSRNNRIYSSIPEVDGASVTPSYPSFESAGNHMFLNMSSKSTTICLAQQIVLWDERIISAVTILWGRDGSSFLDVLFFRIFIEPPIWQLCRTRGKVWISITYRSANSWPEFLNLMTYFA